MSMKPAPCVTGSETGISGTSLDRHLGCLAGLSVGDALGTTLEFTSPGSFEPLRDMVGGGPFGLACGEWTDDTSMALCLAESLIESGGFDAADQMRRYVRWWREGHFSSTGTCFDIGCTVREALAAFRETGEPFSGPSAAHNAGNGSLMRLAPVAMRFASSPREAVRLAGESSRTTHGAPACVDACRYFAALLVGALAGEPKEKLLSPFYSPVPGLWDENPLDAEIAEVAAGSFLTREPPQIRGTGHVVRCLEAALWAFARARDFRDGTLLAVNLGEDADTTGAVHGQLAGAFHGLGGIPPEWLDRIVRRGEILDLASALHNACQERRD